MGERRNKEKTKERLVEAAVEIIQRKGFDAVGVNSVAEAAGVSKVLIYRYFDNFEGLLLEVAKRHDVGQIGSSTETFIRADRGRGLAQIAEEAVLKLHEALENDKLTIQLLAWELTHKNRLTDTFAEAREKAGLELTEHFRRLLPKGSSADVEALMSIVSSSVYYLSLRSRYVRYYNGIDLHSEEGWRRIAKAAGRMAAAYSTETEQNGKG